MKILWILSILTILTAGIPSGNAGSYGDTQVGFPAPTHQELAKFYFEHMDFNGDKILDRSEFEKSEVSKKIKSFDTMQTNENGAVTLEGFIKSYVETQKVQS